MAAASQVTSSENETASGALDQISFYLGRAYYNYVGLLECVLADTGLRPCVAPRYICSHHRGYCASPGCRCTQPGSFPPLHSSLNEKSQDVVLLFVEVWVGV